MRLLLTGFAPFGGEALNPSWEVARALRDAPPDHVDVAVAELPIRPRVALETLLPLWRAERFDAWLGLGQAGGRAHICVERVARNRFRARGDAELAGRAGPQGRGRAVPILERAPRFYLCDVRARRLAAAIRSSGAPARVSYSAGAFLCNQVLYVMEHERRSQRSARAIFLHLPYLPEQSAGKPTGTRSLPLAAQIAGVRAAVVWLRAQGLASGSG